VCVVYFRMGADNDDSNSCGDEWSIMSGRRAGGKSEFSCCSVKNMRAYLSRYIHAPYFTCYRKKASPGIVL